MIGGGAGDIIEVVAAVDGHVGGGVGVPVDGVEEGCLVCVQDGVATAVVVDIESPEGVGMSEHCVLRANGMSPMCLGGQLDGRKISKSMRTSSFYINSGNEFILSLHGQQYLKICGI